MINIFTSSGPEIPVFASIITLTISLPINGIKGIVPHVGKQPGFEINLFEEILFLFNSGRP